MMKENLLEIIIVLLILIFIGIGILFVYEIKQFYNDYKCSTTTDINYYVENNCKRFER